MGQIASLVQELEVERVIVGLPLSLSGGDSAQTREAREFAKKLTKWLRDVPVELYDERFTTLLAQRDGGGAGARASEDSRAAAHLLSSWLDAHSAGSSRG
jgi:putative Holliday junction resolvase